MKEFKGVPQEINAPIVGLLTRNKLPLRWNRSVLIGKKSILHKGFLAIISGDCISKITSPYIIVSSEILEQLKEGDCVLIDRDGTIKIVWEKNAPMNPLLLTEKCNCRCLMCPQPPKEHDKTLLDISKKILRLIKVNDNQTICLTGGEPTLIGEGFFEILGELNKKNPRSNVMMLTNGKLFADFDFTKKFVYSRPHNFLTCVSMHSDVDEIHDMIVGVKGSFYKTAMGLQNLARFRERIEIRVVVSRINATRLESIARFVQRNFPFIFHCTFMGMEITGLACDNYDDLWIDPYEYREELWRAVSALHRADINVSIYNLPLCVLETAAWKFARKSISGWKNDYLPICNECSVKMDCCGIFTTSGSRQSSFIRPQHKD